MAKKSSAKRDSRGRFAPTINEGSVEPAFFANRRNRLEDLAVNILTSRAQLLKRALDPRRNLNDECGYPETIDIDRLQYRDLYDRHPVASRVVDVLPQETWQCGVSIYETEDQDKTTPFEMAWDQLGRSLKADSWHQDEEGNTIWEMLSRADMLSGIGHFGVILIGIDDGKALNMPADGLDDNGRATKAKQKAELTFVDEEGNEVTEEEMLAREEAEAAAEAEGLGEEEQVDENGEPVAGKPPEDGGSVQRAKPGVPPQAPTPSKAPQPAAEETDEEEEGDPEVEPVEEETDEAEPEDTSALPEREYLEDEEEQGTQPAQPDATDPNRGLQGTDAQYGREFSGMAPQPKKAELDGGRKLLYLKTFDESLVQITQYEQSAASPRYGLPKMYRITMNDPRDQHGGLGLPSTEQDVHWTRVIHLADNRTSSDVWGVPRMRPVLDRLLDLAKLYGGSAEMYWQGALPGYSVETHPQLGGDVAIDPEQAKEQMENYQHSLQRWLAIAGVSVKSLAPQVSDPTAHIDKQLEAICIKLAIPLRIFMGSERGELASSQDQGTWNDRLRHRQDKYVTPNVIVPFVDRLIALGILPVPTGYSVKWEDLDALSETEKATVALTRTQAMTTFIGSGGEALMSPEDYLVREMKFTPDEAVAIIEAAKEAEPLQTGAAGGAPTFDAEGNQIDPMTGMPIADAEGNPIGGEDVPPGEEGEEGSTVPGAAGAGKPPNKGAPGQPPQFGKGKKPKGKKPVPPALNSLRTEVLNHKHFNILVRGMTKGLNIAVEDVDSITDRIAGVTYRRGDN